MTDRNRLVAIESDSEPVEAEFEEINQSAEELNLDESWAEDWPEDEAPQSRSFAWVMPVLAGVLVTAWTSFFAWANWPQMSAGAAPQIWIDWIVSWSVPVLLISAIWLLIMRNSRREASRFADAAQSLSAESSQLEERLGVVNRELSMAREFLGAQSRELESLGRVASQRLSEHAEHLQSLVTQNGEQVNAIADVSTTALSNMDKLRDDLPVIANSARDVSNQIGAAGQTAHGQLAELVTGFNRLNEFGQASEQQVDTLSKRIDAALANFEAQAVQLDEIANTRFTALNERSEEFRTDLDQREVDALAAMRRRSETLVEELGAAREVLDEQEEEALRSLRARLGGIRDEGATVGRSLRDSETAALESWTEKVETLRARLTEVIEEVQRVDAQAVDTANTRLQALRDEAANVDEKLLERDQLFKDQVENRRADIAADEEAASNALMQRMAEFDDAIAERRAQQTIHAQTLTEHGVALAARLSELETQMADITAQGEQSQSVIAGGSEMLALRLTESRETLETTGGAIAELTDASVRMLELIQASAQQSGTELPTAISVAEERLSLLGDQAAGIRSTVEEADNKGRSLSDYVIQAQEHGKLAQEQIGSLQSKLETSDEQHVARLESIRAGLNAVHDESVRVAEQSQGGLREAIATLELAARGAVSSLGSTSAGQIQALADSVGEKAAQAIDDALRNRTGDAIAELDLAAEKAASAGREATVQLRDQLALVNELTGNLETRVNHARERAQEQVDNDFARRVALITESLNSNAIDIAKSLSSDVTDTSWAAYLRGDRGIFTRRAVRLLDNQEAREVAGLYEDDPDFQDNVSRYIHDFEAMLRSLLSTRDGNALGVTLLSSDMGKLYVALAQAIERLRE